MVIMNLLRMLVDVSFYGAFAGLIARACGGSGAILGLMIQSICFGLSGLGGRRRGLRMVFLLPILLSWVINRNSPADCILLLPTAIYIIWLVWRNDYGLDDERQRILFDVFWKVLLAVLLFGFLLGGAETLTAVTIPYGLIVLVCSVLLMRSLRHDQTVYCSIRYQAVNLSTVAMVGVMAWLLSTKAFLNACAAGIKAVYNGLFRPILEVLLKLLLYVIEGVVKLFSALSIRKKAPDREELPQLDLSGVENIFGEDIQMKQPSELLRIIGIVLLAAAVTVALILFFRWISRKRGYSGEQTAAREERDRLDAVRRPVRKKESSPVRKIRAQYRSFLKWCIGWNIDVNRSSTSLDIHKQISMVSDEGETSQQIRRLYIKARYAEEAERDDVQKMKQLCDQLKASEKT